jgi:phospholipid/cholesterol/gamma-HCH transport system permease protein
MLDRTRTGLAAVGDVSLFALKAAREIFVPPFELRETLRQIYELGFRSAPLIGVSGLAVGVVLSMHTRASLERFGAESLIPSGLAIALVRETGPLTAALLLSGRIGAGIGAELGAMRVTEQIDALETLAYDPVAYLVVPRLLAALIMLPTLVVLADATGLTSAYLVSVRLTDVTAQAFVEGLRLGFGTFQVVYSLLKAMMFGGAIALVCAYEGYITEAGAEGVGRSTARAVVITSVTILVLDALLTFLFAPLLQS